MLSQLGLYSLYFGIIISLVLFIIKWRYPQHFKEEINRYVRLNFLSAILVWFSFLIIIVAFLQHDYRFQIVFQHSSNAMSSIELIMASWSARQGVMILWAAIMLTISSFVLFYLQDELENKISSRAITITLFFGFLIASFAVSSRPGAFALGDSNSDGWGLQPSLLSFWQEIHPPIAFLAYSAFVFPYAFSLSSLSLYQLKDQISKKLTWLTNFFMLLGWGLTSIMIIAGSIWAYEANWEGFWAWDSIEIASLVMWLAVTIFFHTRALVDQTHPLRLFTASMGWLSVAFASFIIRSGLLDGLHEYAGVERAIVFGLLLFGSLLGVVVATIKSGTQIIPDDFYNIMEFGNKTSLINFWLLTVGVIINVVGLVMQILNAMIVNETTIPYLYYMIFNAIILLAISIDLLICELKTTKFTPRMMALFGLGFIVLAFFALYNILGHDYLGLLFGSILTGIIVTLIINTGYYIFNKRKLSRLPIQIVHIAMIMIMIPYFTVDYSSVSKDYSITRNKSTYLEQFDINVTVYFKEGGSSGSLSSSLATLYPSIMVNVTGQGHHIIELKHGEYKDEYWTEGDWITYPLKDLYFHLLGNSFSFYTNDENPVRIRVTEKPLANSFRIAFMFYIMVTIVGVYFQLKKFPSEKN